MNARDAIALALLLPAVVCAGCSRGGTKLHPVRGRVLFEGKPTPHALVVLHPLDPPGEDAPRPRGQVAADGSFMLSSLRAEDGAPAGRYAVTVEWWLSPTGRGKGDDLPPSNRLPARYSRPETSGLQVAVQPGVNELPVIRLTK
jgi:hypothetical protein